EIGEIIQRTIAVVCEKYTPYLSLTAGRDSRILLACAKELTNKIRFFTWDMPDETAKADIRIAKGLAKTYELLHQVFPFLDSSEADKDQWLFRTGVAVGEIRGLSLATTIKLMDESQPYLPGLASEVGRAFYWQPGDNEKAAMSAEEVVRRLGLPQSERIIAEAKKWLHDLPFTKPYDILDFAYIEQRLGCWAGVTAYGDVEGPIRIPPFSNRRIFALMLSLPYEFRQQQRLAEILIDRMWPDLLRTPFNPVTLRTKIKRRLSKTPFCWRLSRWL
ncbi:MAG: hypothetical protein IID46_06070, partial [Planctomycetes bacterium]|nr:hypothetical protein [Planctomycetota bacterium]